MNAQNKATFNVKAILSEDWLAVWISLLIIILTVIGLFGPNALNITF